MGLQWLLRQITFWWPYVIDTCFRSMELDQKLLECLDDFDCDDLLIDGLDGFDGTIARVHEVDAFREPKVKLRTSHNAVELGVLAKRVTCKLRRGLVQKAVRCQQQLRTLKRITKDQRAAVAKAWNHGRLRRGDRIAIGTPLSRGTRWQHPYAWTVAGTLKIAFDSIGRVEDVVQS